MKFYGYVLLGAFVIMSIIGNIGKAQIEKRIEAGQQTQEADVVAENADYVYEDYVIDGMADSQVKSDDKSKDDIEGSDCNKGKKAADETDEDEGTDTENEPTAALEEKSDQKPASAGASTVAAFTPAQPVHTHNWIATTETRHHDAVTEKIWIIDEAAWDETLYETRNVVICNGCEHEYLRYEQWRDHCSEHFDKGDFTHGSYRLEPKETEIGIKHHDEVGHYDTRIVTPAWDETITIGYRCECGAVK